MKYTLRGCKTGIVRIDIAATCFVCQIDFLPFYQSIKFLYVGGDPFYRSINQSAWWWVFACQVDMYISIYIHIVKRVSAIQTDDMSTHHLVL